jgi:hypothetical protein
LYSFDEEDKIAKEARTRNISFYLLIDSIAGGQSIKLNRYHEVWMIFILIIYKFIIYNGLFNQTR